jgi:hypothetical protein
LLWLFWRWGVSQTMSQSVILPHLSLTSSWNYRRELPAPPLWDIFESLEMSACRSLSATSLSEAWGDRVSWAYMNRWHSPCTTHLEVTAER